MVEPQPTLVKTATTTQVAAGQQVTYTLTARNAAEHPPLYDVVVVDCVPGDLEIHTPLGAALSGPVAGGECASGSQEVRWTLPSPLLGGVDQTAGYTVTVPSTAAAGRPYVNRATLTGTSLPGDQPDERSYSRDTDHTIRVNTPGLAKAVSPEVIVPGQEATWTITASVPQNVWLYNATFIDAMPVQFGTAAAVTSWQLSCGGGDSTWQNDCVTGSRITASPDSDFGVTIEQIPASAAPRTLTLTIRATLPTTATSVPNNTGVSNTARLRWNHAPKTPPANTGASFDSPDTLTATATTTVRHPLVSVTKAVTDTTVEQGQVVTYTVTATASNAGTRNRPAHNVQVVDTVPAGIVVLDGAGNPLANGASTPSGGVWNSAARTLTWTIPTLNPGPAPNAQSFTYSARLAPAAGLSGATLTNSVRPQSWQSLPSGGGSYGPGAAATASVTPQFPRIDTVKTQVSPTNPVYIGQEVTFRFVLTNAGGAPAASLDAVDTLPAGWSYVANSALVTVRSETATQTNPSITGQVLRWNDLGGAAVDLLPGQTITVSYRAVASSSVTVGSSVAHTNTAVAADVTDATGGTSYNNGNGSYVGTPGTATARIHLADVQVTKVANDNFIAGQTGTYTITVRNNGPDPAVGVQVVDTVTPPAGTTVLGATNAAAEGWSCAAPDGTGRFSCGRSNASQTLASGASWTLTVGVAVAADVVDGTTIPNAVTVSSTTEDRTPGNNNATATATVRARADLAVTKAGPPSPVVAGTPIGWTITLVNNGPSVSRGTTVSPIVLSDPLPTSRVGSISIVSQTADAGCAIASGTLRCAIAHDLAVGESVVVTLTGVVNDDLAPDSSIVNTATVTPVTTDPVPGNNAGTSTTPTTVEEALLITKTIIDPEWPAKPIPGETVTYRLQVHNGGPSIARGVYVIDTLPTGLTFDEIVDGSGWTAVPGAGNTVRLNLAGTLGVGQTATVDIRAEIAAWVTGEFTNTAVVSSTWRTDQDDAEVPTGSSPEADLEIVKSVSPATIVAGASSGGTYTLEVTNHGPSDAAAPVTVTDLLPFGMSVRGSLPAGCDQADSDDRVLVTCVRAGLAAGSGTWTITIPVRVAADVTTAGLENEAKVSSPTHDPDQENNTSTEPVGIAQRASLTVTKAASPDPVTAGEDVTWTIRVTNDGPSDAQTVRLSDVLDSRLVLKSATSSSGSCTGTTTLSCDLGTLAPGQTVVLTVVTTVRSSVPEDATIENTATAASTTIDPNTDQPATDSDTDAVTVAAQASLTIDKEAVEGTVDAGGVAAFDIVVGNDGPSDAAADVVVTDTLPDGMTYLASATEGGPAAWDCADVGQTVTCTLTLAGEPATLPAGTTAPTLRISATVASSTQDGTVLTNAATAESPTDPTPPTDDADVEITTHADLGIVKSHAADAIAIAGEPFSWRLTVTNHGPSDSRATQDDPIVVRDVLPDGVTFTSGGGADTSCEVAGEQDGREIVECERTSTLAQGDAVVITLVVDLDQALAGTVTNTATVAPGLTPQPDPDVEPDSDDDQIVLVEVADLTIAKEVLTDPVVAGEPVEWRVTATNLGPSDSDATADDPIRVIDTLPLGVTYLHAKGETWACGQLPSLPDGREQIECLRTTTLRVGEAPAITVTGDVGSSVRGEIANTAEILPGLTEQPPQGEPDEATAIAPVTESADLSIVKTVASDVVAGATGVYRLQVTNLGPSDARAVTIVDTLPSGLGFARVLPAEGGPAWSCAADETDPQQLNCALADDLPDAVSVTLDIEVTAEPELQGDIENLAVVSSETPDPVTDNNESSVTGTIAEFADLSIVKTALNEPEVGGELAYRLQVGNAGPSVARGVLVTDLVPSQLEVVSVTAPGGWECATGEPETEGTPVTCLLAELAVGADPGAIEVVVLVLPEAFPAISNTAVVTAATPEAPETGADNVSTVTNEVPPSVALGIEKELTSPLVAGRSGGYRLVVTNFGPTPDPGPVTVTDELPAGLTVRSWRLDEAAGSCDGSGRLLTCILVGLQVGESVEIGLVVSVAASASGTLVNTATASSPAFPDDAVAQAEGEVDRSRLPNTGATLQALGWALGLLLAGGALVLMARRRFLLEN